MRFLRLAVAVTAATVLPGVLSQAWGHSVLQAPIPRSTDDGLKTGPCGGVAPADKGNVYAPGATIQVGWLETIDHPGSYRIAFSPDGSDAFDANVLVDNHPDQQLGATRANPTQYMVEVTLPSEPCENCVLQLRQTMSDSANPYYYSCADIRIGDADAATDTDASPGDVDASPADDPATEQPPLGVEPGFCAIANPATPAGTPWCIGCALLGCAAVAFSRRGRSNA